MTSRLLESGYWNVQHGPQKFAQWRRGEEPQEADFFPVGTWTKAEMQEAVDLVTPPPSGDAGKEGTK